LPAYLKERALVASSPVENAQGSDLRPWRPRLPLLDIRRGSTSAPIRQPRLCQQRAYGSTLM
jgi:hypothetical protein